AHLFKPETVQKADAELKQIKADSGVEIVIETFPDIPEGQRSAYEAAKANSGQLDQFYANWCHERGRELRLRGVYVLIVKQPSHLQVVAGSETERKAFTRTDQFRLRDTMLGDFKQHQYDDGLLHGVAEARAIVRDNLGGQKLGAAPAAVNHGSSAQPPRGNAPQGSPFPTRNPTPVNRGSSSHFSCFWI